MVENPAPERGNGSSLFAALLHITEESFLLVMGDHLSVPGLLGELLDSGANDRNLLAVDYGAWVPAQIEDATKVLVGEGGLVRDIGKTLRALTRSTPASSSCARIPSIGQGVRAR